MKTLVTPGFNPDLDGLSSALAYVELLQTQGENAVAGFEGTPQLDAKFFLDHLHMRLPPIPAKFDDVVLVDCGAKIVAPYVVRAAPELVVEVIDHRLFHNVEMDFPAVKRVNIEQVGACATILTEMMFQNSVTPSKTVAMLLHGAIHSNTLNLKATVTTERDRAAVAGLASAYPMSQELVEEMFAFRTRLPAAQLTFTLRNDFDATTETPDGKVGIAQVEVLDASALFAEHRDLIHQTLSDLKVKKKLDYVFLTVPSIRQGINYLYAVDEPSAEFVRKYLAAYLARVEEQQAPGSLMKTTKLLLRKEIRPMFQQIP